MSGPIGQSVTGGLSFDGQIAHADDQRALSEAYRMDVELVSIGYEEVAGSYRSPWWPGAGGLIQFADGSSTPDPVALEPCYEQHDINRGSSARYGVVGVTRDAFGNPLAGVTVKLYRTSTDEVCSSIVSDSAGNYVVTTPYYPDAHYIVIYLAGFPDVFGTTVNTLIGA